MIMKTKDLRNNSVSELNSSLENLRKKHMELRFQHRMGALNNPVELRTIKRNIARILTVLREKQDENK